MNATPKSPLLMVFAVLWSGAVITAGAPPARPAAPHAFDTTVLAGDSPEAYNDEEHPGRVVPEQRKLTFTKGTAELPPHSLTIVRATPKSL